MTFLRKRWDHRWIKISPGFRLLRRNSSKLTKTERNFYSTVVSTFLEKRHILINSYIFLRRYPVSTKCESYCNSKAYNQQRSCHRSGSGFTSTSMIIFRRLIIMIFAAEAEQAHDVRFPRR